MEAIATVARAAAPGGPSHEPLPGFAGSINIDGEDVAFLGSERGRATRETENADARSGLRRSTALVAVALVTATSAIMAAMLNLRTAPSALERRGTRASRTSLDGEFVQLAHVPTPYMDSHWQMMDESCAGSFHNVDYENTKAIKKFTGVKEVKQCLTKCLEEEFCAVWSWVALPGVQGLSHLCTLQAARRGMPLVPRRRYGVDSGMRAGVDCDNSGVGRLHGPGRGAAISVSHIRSRQGLCLSSEVAEETGELQMATCSGSGIRQNWTYYASTGLMKNHQGECLAAAKFQKQFSSLLTTHCDQTNWTQQWSYDPSGILKNWRGLCLAVVENRDGGMVCTQPCDISDQSQLWLLGGSSGEEAEEGEEDAIFTTPPPNNDPGTLFCFSLMVPHSYEQKLLAMQFEAALSIFACDAYAVYSNATIWVSRNLTTSVVDSNLTCSKGGEFGTVLNLHIFLTIWTQVVKEGVYLEHDWTVKVDPDAVFFPGRLKSILRSYKEGGNGVYLNNCKFGLHGPVEVLSRRAVQTWSKGWPWCQAHFRERCNGDCFWGEDMFMDQCLSKILGVTRDSDFRLLVEDHCDAPSDWDSCTDDTKSAFHPFKTLSGYQSCMHNAVRGKASADTSSHSSVSTSSPSTASERTKSSSSSAAKPDAGRKALKREHSTTTRPGTTTTPEIALR